MLVVLCVCNLFQSTWQQEILLTSTFILYQYSNFINYQSELFKSPIIIVGITSDIVQVTGYSWTNHPQQSEYHSNNIE